MPRVAVQGENESDESHLVKVDPGGTFEQFIEQAESRLGFRPAAVYLNGTRVMSVEDRWSACHCEVANPKSK